MFFPFVKDFERVKTSPLKRRFERVFAVTSRLFVIGTPLVIRVPRFRVKRASWPYAISFPITGVFSRAACQSGLTLGSCDTIRKSTTKMTIPTAISDP